MAVITALYRRQQSSTNEISSSGNVLAADPDSPSGYTPLMANLITAFIVLMLCGLALSGALFYLRVRRRRAAAARMQAALEQGMAHPNMTMQQQQRNASLVAPGKPAHHRRTKSLTTPPQSPVFLIADDEEDDERDGLMGEQKGNRMVAHGGSGGARKASEVPQIHLTFPEEVDEKTGKRASRVVVVTVSDKGSVGLRPFGQEEEEALPPYSESEDMQHVDLDKVGGLKEGITKVR